MIYIAFLLFTFFIFIFAFYQWQYFVVFNPTYFRDGDFGDDYETLSITTSDGVELEGVVYEPADAKSTLLFFGGRSHDSVGLMKRLASEYKGSRIISFNYRSYGRSGGSVNEKNILSDALEIAKIIQKNYGDFYILGFSIGSSVAISVASKHKTLGLFLVGAFDSITSLAKKKYGLSIPWLFRYKFDNIEPAKKIDAPTYLFVSKSDETTYIKNARNLEKSIKKLVLYKELDNLSHKELFWCGEVSSEINKVLDE